MFVFLVSRFYGRRRFSSYLLFKIQLIFELTFHDAGHTPGLAQPAAELIGDTRQTFRAQDDEPDKKQNDQLPKADSGHE